MIPAEDGRDFVIIIVDPPDGRLWPVLQTSEQLHDGDVYMRVDGATRRATGHELSAMVRRAHARMNRQLLNVAVEPTGLVQALIIDSRELRELIEWHAEQLEAQVESASAHSALPILHASHLVDRRSEREFLDEVEEWRASALDAPASGLHGLAAQFTRPFALRITNETTTSLKDVRVEVTFDVPLTPLDWREPNGTINLFPERPISWGADTYFAGPPLKGFTPSVHADAYDGAIRVPSRQPPELVVELRRLHAEQKVVTPDEDTILVLFADGADDIPAIVTAQWSLVAGGVNEVLRGAFELEVAQFDWRQPLHSVISRIRGDAPTEEG